MRLVAYLIAITWAIYCYSNAYFFMPVYLGLHQFPKELTGILVGAFYAATTLVRPFGGFITERAGIKRTLIISAVSCICAATLKFFTLSFAPLLLIRILMGCSFGIFIVALTTYQSLVIPEESRGVAFAYISIGSLGCLATVVPLADLLLSYQCEKFYLSLPIISAFFCMILSIKLPPLPENVKKTTENQEWGTWGELYENTPFWRIAASNALFNLCDAANIYLPAFAIAMKLVPSSFSVAVAIGAFTVRTLGGKIFTIFPRYALAGPSLFTMALSLILSAYATNNALFFMCGLLFGAGMGYGYPAQLSLIGDLAPAKLRAKLSSLVHFCIDISWFLIPLYMGFATPHIGEVGAFKLLSIVCMISGILVTAMWSKYEKSKRAAKC
ncbi:MAG: MFS transporter [Synergistaceae bacterium]|nr:MFS transporter [Synergistaceae bacterium]